MSATLWIVGQNLTSNDSGRAWAFQGVFDTEVAAVLACRTKDYFIAPAVLNEALPHEDEGWPGAYYPHLERRPGEGGDEEG